MASWLVRVVVPDVLEPCRRSELASEIGYKGFDDPLVRPVIEAVQGKFDVTVGDPSYVRVEDHPAAQDWHVDNGRHMPWCAVSASVLLTACEGRTDGVFAFRDGPVAMLPGDLWIWDSIAENEHRRAAHAGWRRMLLMFLAQA